MLILKEQSIGLNHAKIQRDLPVVGLQKGPSTRQYYMNIITFFLLMLLSFLNL